MSYLYIPPCFGKTFIFIALRLLENVIMAQKIESTHFYSCPRLKLSPRFWLSSPRQKKITHFSQTPFLKIYLHSSKKGEKKGNCGAESKTKIKLVRVLTGSFDKSVPLCTLHMYVFIILWRFFNLANKIFTKKYSV